MINFPQFYELFLPTVRVCVGIHWCAQVCTGLCGYTLVCPSVHGFVWVYVGVLCAWVYVGMCGCVQVCVELILRIPTGD